MFRYENFNAISTKFLSPIERVVEFTPRGAEGIDKVLSLSVDGKALSHTVCDGYVDLNGRADFTLIYLDLDGNPSSANYNADFAVRLAGDVAVGDTVHLCVKVVEWRVLTADTTTLSAVIKIYGTCFESVALDMLTGADDSYVTTTSVTIPTCIASTTYSFPVDDETVVGEVEKVLSLDTKCVLTHTKVKDKLVDVSVDTIATVTYVQDGKVCLDTFNITTDESVALENICDDDKVLVLPYVKSGKIVLAGVTGENILRFEGEIGASIDVVRYADVEVVEDLFSLTHHTDTVKKSQSLTAFCGSCFAKEKIVGETTLPDDGNGIFVGVPSSTAFVAKAICDEGLTVEGVASTEILYSVDGDLHSVRAEIPFSVQLDGDYTQDTFARVSVMDTSVKIKGGNAEISLVLGFEITTYCTDKFEYISAVELGEERPVNTSGLSMYVADEGDTMWDVCKALTATPEQIISQNPNLTFPLPHNTKILYFRQLKE